MPVLVAGAWAPRGLSFGQDGTPRGASAGRRWGVRSGGGRGLGNRFGLIVVSGAGCSGQPCYATMATAIVTGANRGIGLALATLLQQREHAVIAACRTSSAEL